MSKRKYNLFIKICTPPTQIALVESDDFKIYNYFECDIQDSFIPSRDLIGVIYKSLIHKNITLYDINNIFLLSGPGSYTACRMGAAVAKLIYFITKRVDIFESNLLDLYMCINKTVLNSNQNFLINKNNLISISYAYNHKYYVALANLKSSIKYHLLYIEELNRLLTDDIYIVNGKVKNRSQILQINRSDIEEKISYEVWFKNSAFVKNINSYEPFYFDKDVENIN